MRTKEISIWVSDSGLKQIISGERVDTLEYRPNQFARFKHEIKFQVPLPERKVEITEKDIDEAFIDWKRNGKTWGEGEMIKHMKATLFKDHT